MLPARAPRFRPQRGSAAISTAPIRSQAARSQAKPAIILLLSYQKLRVVGIAMGVQGPGRSLPPPIAMSCRSRSDLSVTRETIRWMISTRGNHALEAAAVQRKRSVLASPPKMAHGAATGSPTASAVSLTLLDAADAKVEDHHEMARRSRQDQRMPQSVVIAKAGRQMHQDATAVEQSANAE